MSLKTVNYENKRIAYGSEAYHLVEILDTTGIEFLHSE